MPFPTYAKQDEIPEAFRGEYEEREGVWHPKVPDVTKLTGALQKERDKAAEQDRLRKEAEKERDELKREAQARAAGISQEELEKIRAAEKEARRPIEKERDDLRAENRKLKLTDRVKALALSAGVMQDRIDDAMLLLASRTDLTDADGIVVKDEDGKITSETIDDFLDTTFKKESPWFYAGAGSSGSGAQGSTGTGDVTLPPPDPTYQERRAHQVGANF